MSLLQYLYRILFGYDFFISYSRKDCTEYASTLSKEITTSGFSCFIDQLGTEPGRELPKRLKQKIKSSSVLILLGTNEASNSKAIEEEIDLFIPTKRPIIPVDFGKLKISSWYGKIDGIAVFTESEDNLLSATPSVKVVERALNSFTYAKQSKRIRRSAIGALIIILITAIAVMLSFVEVSRLDTEIVQKEAELEHNKKELTKSHKELKVAANKLTEIERDLNLREEELEKVNLQLDSTKKLVIKTEKMARQYLDAAKKREENSRRLIRFIEDGIEDLYPQPLLTGCATQQITRKTPLTLHVYLDRILISDKSKLLLDTLIKCMIDEDPQVVVSGYVSTYIWLNEDAERSGNDDIGASSLVKNSEAYSLAVAQRMANSVKKYFIEKGVKPENVVTIGYGIDDRYSLDFMNNRVEVFIVP